MEMGYVVTLFCFLFGGILVWIVMQYESRSFKELKKNDKLIKISSRE